MSEIDSGSGEEAHEFKVGDLCIDAASDDSVVYRVLEIYDMDDMYQTPGKVWRRMLLDPVLGFCHAHQKNQTRVDIESCRPITLIDLTTVYDALGAFIVAEVERT